MSLSKSLRSPCHPLPLWPYVVGLVWSCCRSEWEEIQLMSSWWSYSQTRLTHSPSSPCMESQLVNHWPSRESPVCTVGTESYVDFYYVAHTVVHGADIVCLMIIYGSRFMGAIVDSTLSLKLLNYNPETNTNHLPHFQCPCHLRANWQFVTSPTAPWGLFGMLLLVLFASTLSPTSLRMEMLKKWAWFQSCLALLFLLKP